jgi:catechol 2,3-dioxygenase-like lactoylglutathione lyase family enzyme
MQLNQVRLLVTNFDGCFRFYRDVLSLPVGFGDEGNVYADFKLGGELTLALYDRQEMAQAVGTTNLPAVVDSQDRVSLTFGVDDLEATVADLQTHGVELVAEPTDRPDWGMRTAHFRDPDGNLLEIFVPLPMEG